MTALDTSRRRPRRFWGDTRFLLGMLLIGLSIGGVWLVVQAARQTTPVYAAAHTLVPGQTVSTSDLRVVDVALGQVGEAYLSSDALGDGAVAMRTIEEGELVPAGALGTADAARTTTVVIETASDVSASVVEGARVEVWFAPPRDRESFDEPRILVPDATVAAVTRDDAMLGSARATLEVVIPRADVAATLAAQSDGSVLSIVPISGSGG